MTEELEKNSDGARVVGWLSTGVASASVAVGCVLFPIFVIRPFHPQDPTQLQEALRVHDLGPWIAGLCAVVVAAVTAWSWMRVSGSLGRRWSFRAAMLVLYGLALVGACLTHVNFFEKVMFHPYESLAFESASYSKTEPGDKVLAVRLSGHARAYPILTMGYHHVVNDTVEGVPIAMTYCTLCHTGIAWDPVVDGRRLHFRLAGINNGNALLRDEETKSVWQQSTGEALYGPLKGRHLRMIHSDEMSFALWEREQPGGDVLKPDSTWVAQYDGRDWETQVEKTPAMVDTKRSGIGPHQLMLGVDAGGKYKAYPIETVLGARFIQDSVADSPVLVLVGSDGASIRVFNPEEMTFTPGDKGAVIRDVETGSGCNFQGCAVQGKMAGRCLKAVNANKDYWFDWMNHHPETAVYKG